MMIFQPLPKHPRMIGVLALMTSLMVITAGCENPSTHDDPDAHEMDHFVPAHWPKDIADISDKIDERLKLIEPSESLSPDGQRRLQQELVDIVAWSPEIAADSFLTEADWEPVYRESLRLTETLRDHPLEPGDRRAKSLQQFSGLIRTAAEKEAGLRPKKDTDKTAEPSTAPESKTGEVES